MYAYKSFVRIITFLLAIAFVDASMLASSLYSADNKVSKSKKRNAKSRKRVKKEVEIDVSDLSEEYWRPKKDELEVIQDKRFKKEGRIGVDVQYGFYLNGDFVDSTSLGGALSYNITERLAVEASYFQISTSVAGVTTSFEKQFNIQPNYNVETATYLGMLMYTPIYAKFSLLGKKISHFETYVAVGAGETQTETGNTSSTKVFNKNFTIALGVGQKFFVNRNLMIRWEWRVSEYTDKVVAVSGGSSVARGGSGFLEESPTRHNLIIGLGWIF